MNYDENIERGGVYAICPVHLFQNISLGTHFGNVFAFKAKPVCLVQMWHSCCPSSGNLLLVNYAGHSECVPEKPIRVPSSGSFDHLAEKLL